MTDNIVDLGQGGGDRVQRLAIVVPCYLWLSTTFFNNFVNMTQTIGEFDLVVMKGVYLPQAMRHALEELSEKKEWERLLIVEQDMILPSDAFIKHSLHTDDIVGSVYFQHAPPYRINCMFDGGEKGMGIPKAPLVQQMLERPALYKCATVGMGCTSISRRVFEEWEEGLPFFRNEYVDKKDTNDDDWQFSHGEISHDVWFCREATRQGFEIYLDTSIRCNHLTEGHTDERHFFMANQKDLQQSRIVLPEHERRKRQSDLAKAGRP